MSLFDDLLLTARPAWHGPPAPQRSRALNRRCRHCHARTVGGATRCAACSHAERGRSSGTPDKSGLPVSCWCEATTVWCEVRLIAAGVTRSCGLPTCDPERIAA